MYVPVCDSNIMTVSESLVSADMCGAVLVNIELVAAFITYKSWFTICDPLTFLLVRFMCPRDTGTRATEGIPNNIELKLCRIQRCGPRNLYECTFRRTTKDK
ncbi:uncharacterized protein FTJAE_5055 [Fusarium tjaetaba]|uniref:Uncharacterized protein n=1 Tax=Fusarium tjaetaba TaxID=1567544 RepID=A0A8H5RTS9_9HYPO|nr:uncharacterized protein FTJAE_5055 [Fusarium tjaetaba]KAF5638984.1 hypothetical protein FTJAE_5055 [Fusarium tjaetaba]